MSAEHSVAVIITAKDCAHCAPTAVASALAQKIAREVVFVDDASRDGTAAAAASADDGSQRLKIIRLPVNRGPSHGRNLAMAASSAPYLCILDADDFMAAGRLERMFDRGGDGWDVLADDLLIVDADDQTRSVDRLLPPGFVTPHWLDFTEFVAGNLPRRGRSRREMGFLKPLLRRAFIEARGIRYDERVRLGEDMLFYSRCLIAGARFRVVEACGYHAVQYPNSLSVEHRTEDLAQYYDALVEFEAQARRDGHEVAPLARCVRSTRNRLALRRALDSKRQGGWPALLAAVRASPECLPFILRSVAIDKIAAVSERVLRRPPVLARS